MAQSLKHPTLNFGSGHDLMVYKFKPLIGLCTDSVEPALDSLSPSLPAPPLCACSLARSLSLSLSLNK